MAMRMLLQAGFSPMLKANDIGGISEKGSHGK